MWLFSWTPASVIILIVFGVLVSAALFAVRQHGTAWLLSWTPAGVGFVIAVGAFTCATLFVIAYTVALLMTANFGKGAVVQWDNAVPPSLGGRNAPRIYQEGVVTDKGCSFSLQLTSNPWDYQTVAREVWANRDECERVVEVFNVRKKH